MVRNNKESLPENGSDSLKSINLYQFFTVVVKGDWMIYRMTILASEARRRGKERVREAAL